VGAIAGAIGGFAGPFMGAIASKVAPLGKYGVIALREGIEFAFDVVGAIVGDVVVHGGVKSWTGIFTSAFVSRGVSLGTSKFKLGPKVEKLVPDKWKINPDALKGQYQFDTFRTKGDTPVTTRTETGTTGKTEADAVGKTKSEVEWTNPPQTKGDFQAKELGFPESPPGHHWRKGPNGKPILVKNSSYKGSKLEFDPESKAFKPVKTEVEWKTPPKTAGDHQAKNLGHPEAPPGHQWVKGKNGPYLRRVSGYDGPKMKWDPETGTFKSVDAPKARGKTRGDEADLETTRAKNELSDKEFEMEMTAVNLRRPGKKIDFEHKGIRYTEEVELPNGHKWRRRADGGWCRFSRRICYPTGRLTKGQQQAQGQTPPWPNAPRGYHWREGKNGKPSLVRDKGGSGGQIYYDPSTGTFKPRTANSIPPGTQANHIFSGRPQKFSDTPANRALITDLANNTYNYLGKDRFGKSWYAETVGGRQHYAYTQNGVIKGAGYNIPPRNITLQQGLTQ
jgi:hypothetical protein